MQLYWPLLRNGYKWFINFIESKYYLWILLGTIKAKSPGLPSLTTFSAGVSSGWPAHWEFHRPVDTVGAYIDNELGWYNRASISCASEQQILERCGPEGLKKREKNHFFCANGDLVKFLGMNTNLTIYHREMDFGCKESGYLPVRKENWKQGQ